MIEKTLAEGSELNVRFGEYEISDDKKKLDLETVHGFLKRSYWAAERSFEVMMKSIHNSRCYGVYAENGKQVAFARLITDDATIYYLCDVFVDEEYRGKGIGQALVGSIFEAHKELTGSLATNDAHGLYEKYGFETVDGRYMRKRPDPEKVS